MSIEQWGLSNFAHNSLVALFKLNSIFGDVLKEMDNVTGC